MVAVHGQAIAWTSGINLCPCQQRMDYEGCQVLPAAVKSGVSDVSSLGATMLGKNYLHS